jgi:ATP-dependent protease ClpP protease subunit
MKPVWCSNVEKLPISVVNEVKLHTNYNKVYFRDVINEHTMSELCKELNRVDEELFYMSKDYSLPTIPIYLFITTDGGEVYAVLRAIDCISQLTSPVYTIVDGLVASAGTLLSIVGKKRFIQPSGYMLIHQLRSNVWGKMKDIEDEVENLKKLMIYIVKLYSKKTNISSEQLEKMLKNECILEADECIKNGLVDKIYTTSNNKKSCR